MTPRAKDQFEDEADAEYLEISEGVRVLAIAHDRRSPGYWKTRLP